LGLTSTAFHVGFLTGPSLGGFLIDTIGWRWIFYINMPFSLWGAYLAWKIIPETRAKEKVSIDIPGALLLLVSNGLFIYAIDQLPRLGWGHPTFLLILSLSVVALAFLLLGESRTKTLILILSMFRTRLLSAVVLSLFVCSLDLHASILRIMFPLALWRVGWALFNSPNQRAILGAVTTDKIGAAAGMIATTARAGGAIGVALSATLFSYFLSAAGLPSTQIDAPESWKASPDIFMGAFNFTVHIV